MTLLAGLPYRHFAVGHADVPWTYQTYSDLGLDRSAEAHYGCMTLRDIARLDVGAHMKKDAYLFFWVTGPHLVIGSHIPIMRSWGFEPVAMAFVWVKLNRNWHPRWLTYIEDAMFFYRHGAHDAPERRIRDPWSAREPARAAFEVDPTNYLHPPARTLQKTR